MNRGDVVELDWPFSDLTGSKRRPAVVVQADYLNGLIDDTILVKITGSRFGIPGTEVAIDPVVETASGLSKVCGSWAEIGNPSGVGWVQPTANQARMVGCTHPTKTRIPAITNLGP